MNPEELNFNNNEGNQNQHQSLIEKLTSKDVLNLSLDIIPSILYLICITCVLAQTPLFCDEGYPLILRAFFIIYSAFILKAFLYSLLVHLNKVNILASIISMTSLGFIINMSYYAIVALAYIIYTNSPNNCLIRNTLGSFTLFAMVMIGVIYISIIFLKFIMMLICFPIMVSYFMSNPHSFYSQYGIDPELVNNLPTIKATKSHCISCVICTEDIKLKDEIFILRCPGRHHFHGSCIKSWLRVKVTCPICRSDNVL